jgi:hypothetical protein
MTIGIGVLCSTEGSTGKKSDALALISDTMGSTETDSTILGKMFIEAERNLYAVCAGNAVTAAEIFHTISSALGTLTVRHHGSIWRTLSESVNGVRSEKFLWDVIHTQHIVGNSIVGRLVADDPANILASWRTYDVGAQLLVGTFDDEGQALLYYLGAYEGRAGLVHLEAFPGHCCIGAGFTNASAWLNHRGQRLDFGVKRSLYHAFEASRMAASAPSVNEDVEILIATKDAHGYFSPRRSEPGPFDISIPELEKMYRKHGPQSTERIAFTVRGGQ